MCYWGAGGDGYSPPGLLQTKLIIVSAKACGGCFIADWVPAFVEMMTDETMIQGPYKRRLLRLFSDDLQQNSIGVALIFVCVDAIFFVVG